MVACEIVVPLHDLTGDHYLVQLILGIVNGRLLLLMIWERVSMRLMAFAGQNLASPASITPEFKGLITSSRVNIHSRIIVIY